MRLAAIQPPRLRTAEESGDRSATWLELFYDLVFVVAVALLGVRLLEDTSWTGLASYLGYFIALWWLWASFTFYADRYDTDDLVYRLLAAGQMVAIAFLAASISSGPTGSTTAFALAYAAARIILILMYERARRHVPETQVLVTGYIRGFALGAGIWIISAVVPEPFRFLLWAIALAIEFATPYIMRREQAKVPLDVSHLPERFGLFTILVLGESIAAVIIGLSGRGWELAPTITAALGVVVATGMWWMYFDNLEGSVVRRRADQAKAWKPTVWIFSHLPLAAGVAMTGVGLEHAVVEAGEAHAHTASRWLLVGAVALAFAAMAAILIATVPRRGGTNHLTIARVRLAAVPFILAIGLLSAASSVVIVLLLAAICCVEVAVDVVVQTRAAVDVPSESA